MVINTSELTAHILDTLRHAIGAPVTVLAEAPAAVLEALNGLESPSDGCPLEVSVADVRYLVATDSRLSMSGLVVGPFRLPDASLADSTELVSPMRAGAAAALTSALQALLRGQTLDDERLELASHLEVVGRSVLAITGELTLDLVLRRIVDLARELAGARYAALGVPDGRGGLAEFLTSGMTDEQERRIGTLPRGLGLLGELLRIPETIRVADLRTHPASVGFPANHPPMTSFLGVPIFSHGRVLGNLYLTDKLGAQEFSEGDARLVELLASHAAVALENAQLYHDLQDQERQLHVILDQLPEAVVMWEPSPPRVTWMNSQAHKLLGIEAEPPIPMETFADLLVLRDEHGVPVPYDQRPMFRSLLAGEKVIRQEVNYESAQDRTETFLVNSVPVLKDDEVTAAVVVFQDITPIKEADQLKDDFLSLVSHELRTPLTTIHGGSQMLLNNDIALDEAERAALLRDVHNESSRLATLIQNMVQLAHVRAGRLKLEVEPVLVSAVLRRCLASLEDEISERAIRIQTEPDLVALADPNSVDEILRNLVQNALKYTPDGTPIDTGARRLNGAIEIYVRDYGQGLSDEEMVRIFDRFERGHRARNSQSSGMGLGLYLVRNLVEAQGGAIRVEQPPDGGTLFAFSLPSEESE